MPGTGKRREYLARYSPLPPKGIASRLLLSQGQALGSWNVLEVLFCVW